MAPSERPRVHAPLWQPMHVCVHVFFVTCGWVLWLFDVCLCGRTCVCRLVSMSLSADVVCRFACWCVSMQVSGGMNVRVVCLSVGKGYECVGMPACKCVPMEVSGDMLVTCACMCVHVKVSDGLKECTLVCRLLSTCQHFPISRSICECVQCARIQCMYR